MAPKFSRAIVTGFRFNTGTFCGWKFSRYRSCKSLQAVNVSYFTGLKWTWLCVRCLETGWGRDGVWWPIWVRKAIVQLVIMIIIIFWRKIFLNIETLKREGIQDIYVLCTEQELQWWDAKVCNYFWHVILSQWFVCLGLRWIRCSWIMQWMVSPPTTVQSVKSKCPVY